MMRAHQPGQAAFTSVLPGGTPHFHWAKSGEYVTQVTGIGPLGLEYLDPDDDPRERSGRKRPAPGQAARDSR